MVLCFAEDGLAIEKVISYFCGPAVLATTFRNLDPQELPTRAVSEVREPGSGTEAPRLTQRGHSLQDFFVPNKTAYENVAFALEVTEASKREIRRRVPAALELVGLKHKFSAMPHQLSGGEQQRISIARAIVNNPLILLADEPTGNLDPATSWEIMELLCEINKRGTTVLMATHNREIVDQMKKRVVALDEGKVVRDEQRGVYCL